MRLRRNPEAKPFLIRHPRVFVPAAEHVSEWRGKWKSRFARPDLPLYVELGTGKGQFLAQASLRHPDINWIGVERIEEPLFQAVKKAEQTRAEAGEDPDNLLYIWMDAEKLPEVFANGEADRLYLHFSDPWPKKRHAKRRLTHRRFLDLYARLLSSSGDLVLKTDSRSLYEFSLEEFKETGWTVVEWSEDLHHSPFAESNIATEYEQKFVSKGMPIHYVRAVPPRFRDDR
ncbi:tRNA (guanosine(46)-N7)-methyltransferase TrmB [Staphylospora marina]|uniref:tRNA (guanosine(46)-N7)-methyltransferase TrmB n=1 Tax=Staphylospora marina TaxID=2490858 RepID=UPI000F5BF70D|nr:tRNA (guanosine(46)-N7)-methyltransferase TrmB [Staphylospora marina]